MAYYSPVDSGPAPELADFTPSQGLSFRSAVSGTFSENPTPLLWDAAKLYDAKTSPYANLRLDKATAENLVKEAGVSLKIPDDGYTPEALQILIGRQRDAAARQSVDERTPWGFGSLLRGSAQLMAGVVDPLNIASAFIPVVGEARYASMLERAGASAFARAGVRARVGAAEGFVGAAVLEPGVYGLHQSLQDDYTMSDSLVNLAFGAALGGGLHASGGVVGDALRSEPMRAPPAVAEAPPAIHETALRASIADAVNGMPPQVEALFASRPITAQADDLRSMASGAYWAQRGGHLIRDTPAVDPNASLADLRFWHQQGDVVGRTPWVPAQEWFAGMRSDLGRAGLTGQDEIAAAVEKAIKGESLTKPEADTVEWMRREVEAVRRESMRSEYGADGEFLWSAVVDAGLHAEDVSDAHKVMRASEIDQAAVERAAIQHENDTHAFMAEIERIYGQGQPTHEGRAYGGSAEDFDAIRASRQSDPDKLAIGSPDASRAADARLKDAPKDQGVETATAELADATEQFQAIRKNLELAGYPPERLAQIDEAMKAFDEGIRDSKNLGDAILQNALCGIRQ